jgi:transcriptional regulator with XRE-family HTH domain
MYIPISTENRPSFRYDAGMATTDGDYEVKPFGEALKYLRDRAKLTQRQIAAMMEMGNTSTLSDWERRIDAPNKPYELEKLAGILGWTLTISRLAGCLSPRQWSVSWTTCYFRRPASTASVYPRTRRSSTSMSSSMQTPTFRFRQYSFFAT